MTSPTRQSGLNSFTASSEHTEQPDTDSQSEHSQPSNTKTNTEHTVSDQPTDDPTDQPPEEPPETPQTPSDVSEAAEAIAGKDTTQNVDVVTPAGVPNRPTESSTDTATGDVDITIDSEEIAETWGAYFPHDTPYDQQIDAIERSTEILRDRGYFEMEGACGTGKTIIALAACLQLTRDESTDFERTVVGTPVKQQLKQFVEEVRDINANISANEPDIKPARAVVLVGKNDLHPYLREGKTDTDTAVQDTLDDMRERTVDLVKKNSLIEFDWPREYLHACADGSCHEQIPTNYTYCDNCEKDHPDVDNGPSMDDGPWYDEVRAQAIVDIVRETTQDNARLSTGGVTSPFPADPPSQDLVVDSSKTGVADIPFDPFYAGFLANGGMAPFSAFDGTEYVLEASDLVEEAVTAGSCPHECMSYLAKSADIVIGNYNHIFDPETRKLTEDKMGILTEDTLTIIDEAHMLEERVRDMLSETLGLHDLKIAFNDFGSAMNALDGSNPQDSKTAYSVLNQLDIEKDELEQTREFLKWIGDFIDEEVTEYLTNEYGDWENKMKAGRLPNWDMEVPLRDPKRPSTDRMTEAAMAEGFDGKMWAKVGKLGRAVEMIHDRCDIDRQPAAEEVCEILNRWYVENHEHFFREIELQHAPKDQPLSSDRPWTEDYNGKLTLFNCIPSEKLANIFDQLGGGFVMSATLQPMDVYTEVSGLSRVASTGRPIETVNYGLQFPVENRASWTVDAARFTGRNRGKDTTVYDDMSDTRLEHARVLRDIGDSHGNVLICMPSYKEAEWAHTILERSAHITKDVHMDESSSREATDSLLDEFFAEDEYSILVTSTRGTVTEGVDYDGEKLHTCAVFGIPIVNIGSPRMKAVIQAYGATFGEDNDFEYALTVPAVRKARQAIGRVIRGADEVGTRILVDERYTEGEFRSVYEHLSPQEQEEFQEMTGEFVKPALADFWADTLEE